MNPRTSSNPSPLACILVMRGLISRSGVLPGSVCIHRRQSWDDHLMSSPSSGFWGSSRLAASQPTNQAEHDSFQGCFRLLWSELDRTYFMEMEPRQLSKWDFFLLHSVSPFSSFTLSCSCLTALLGPYNLNVLWFASPASCLALTVMAGFFSKDNPGLP